jgi:hypothetical protein
MNNFLNACGCEGHSSASGKVKPRIIAYGGDILDTVKSGAYDVFDVVKGAGEFVVDEAKDGYDKVKEQGDRLDKKERIIKSVPNSYLVFGAIGLLIFTMVKK